MQNQIQEKPTLTANRKKKKNKGWNCNEPTHQQPKAQEQIIYSQAIPELLNIQSVQTESISQQEVFPTKKLSEMGNTYHIEMQFQLGSGYASVVYIGENIHTKQIVCVKVIDYMCLGGELQKKALQRQIKYLKSFNSKNVVKLLDVYQSPSFCYLIMQFCKGGDLFKFLMQSQPLHPLFVRRFIQQICLGLKQLKDKKLIHRDLKTENIFLDQFMTAKIGDLGFCISVGEDEVIHNVGSPIYMSPQVLQGNPHTFASDMYGLGIIWYELLHQRAPWQAKTQTELLSNKLTDPVHFTRTDLSDKDKQIITSCLSVNPKERYSVQDMLSYCGALNALQMQNIMKEQQMNVLSSSTQAK